MRTTVLFLWVVTPCRLAGVSENLKMETVRFSEALVSTYKSTQRKNIVSMNIN
jgi:hypothetical protein